MQDGRTALHLAASKGYDVIVRELLDRGSSPAAIDKAGRTALHLAAAGGHIDAAKALLRKGCPLLMRDEDGKTALDYARAGNKPAMLSLLQGALAMSSAAHAAPAAAPPPSLTAGYGSNRPLQQPRSPSHDSPLASAAAAAFGSGRTLHPPPHLPPQLPPQQAAAQALQAAPQPSPSHSPTKAQAQQRPQRPANPMQQLVGVAAAMLGIGKPPPLQRPQQDSAPQRDTPSSHTGTTSSPRKQPAQPPQPSHPHQAHQQYAEYHPGMPLMPGSPSTTTTSAPPPSSASIHYPWEALAPSAPPPPPDLLLSPLTANRPNLPTQPASPSRHTGSTTSSDEWLTHLPAAPRNALPQQYPPQVLLQTIPPPSAAPGRQQAPVEPSGAASAAQPPQLQGPGSGRPAGQAAAAAAAAGGAGDDSDGWGASAGEEEEDDWGGQSGRTGAAGSGEVRAVRMLCWGPRHTGTLVALVACRVCFLCTRQCVSASGAGRADQAASLTRDSLAGCALTAACGHCRCSSFWLH